MARPRPCPPSRAMATAYPPTPTMLCASRSSRARCTIVSARMSSPVPPSARSHERPIVRCERRREDCQGLGCQRSCRAARRTAAPAPSVLHQWMGLGERLGSIIDQQELDCRIPCVHKRTPGLVWSRGPGRFAGSGRMSATEATPAVAYGNAARCPSTSRRSGAAGHAVTYQAGDQGSLGRT
jgi:hypothetical protein